MTIITDDGERFPMSRKTVLDMVRKGAGVTWNYEGRQHRGDISGKYWAWQLQVGDHVRIGREWRVIKSIAGE